MTEKSENTSFWKTLPGILTGLAAVITAIAGLIGALNMGGDDSIGTDTTITISGTPGQIGGPCDQNGLCKAGIACHQGKCKDKSRVNAAYWCRPHPSVGIVCTQNKSRCFNNNKFSCFTRNTLTAGIWNIDRKGLPPRTGSVARN